MVACAHQVANMSGRRKKNANRSMINYSTTPFVTITKRYCNYLPQPYIIVKPSKRQRKQRNAARAAFR